MSTHRSFTFLFSAGLLLIGGAQGIRAQNGHYWTIQRVERRMLVDDVARYRFVVAVGPGQRDRIRIHRVVRELHPQQPAHLSEAVMLFAEGFSHSSDYTASFAASHDVTIRNVQLLSDAQQSEDYGHVDLLTGYNAEYLVWQPILEWIKAHR